MKRFLTQKARLYLALWLVYSAYMTVQVYVTRIRLGLEITWAAAAGGEFLYGGLWLAFTPLILYLARKIPFRKPGWPAALAAHFVLGIVIAVTHAWAFTFTGSLYREIVLGIPFAAEAQVTRLVTIFDYGIHLYWLVILLDYVYEYYFIAQRHELNAATLEAQLAGARLNALTMQVRPHFLFNTLNSISVLIGNEPETARRMIGRLADLLRQTLTMTDTTEIPLGKEMEFLKNYLEIEKIRFRDRLTIDYRVDPETLRALVPALILQPLAENSVRHGVSKFGGSGTICVTAERRNGRLRLAVSNTGGGLDAPAAGGGIGLSNTRSRLKHLYGDDHLLSLHATGSDGVTAEITLPFRVAPEDR